MYVAEGYGVNALGLPDDFEFIIGGPGGGSNFDAFNASAAMGLYYWEAGARVFRVVPSAYDVGGDTGETAAGLASTWAAGADAALGGPPGPAAYLSQGPSFLTGEWNVTNATAGSTVLHLRLAPQNGFTFLAAGTAPSESAFQWVPPAGPYTVVPGEYSVVALASHFIPDSTTLLTAPGSSWLNLTLSGDPSAGVYTPLWALSNADLPNISSSCGGGGCTLWNDESRPLGSPSDWATAYPWFGAFNDFFYPELPGILLWNVTHVVMASPPSLEVLTPSWLRNESLRFGTPSSNDLPTFCYDDSAIRLAGAGAIGGWWFAGSYLGPAAAQASVVFWNTSASLVANNTFLTSGEGLFLYGGTNNTIVGNTFLNYLPLAPDEGSIAGAVAGTAGLFEAERGDGGAGGSGCGCADLVYNNAFGTYFPAIEPTVDPYTGLPPRLPFDARWNVTPTPGPNIVGGTELGGNFWWNYGDSTDPYWVLPYNASGEISTGGDEHPVVPEPLWTVTFVEQGLPTGTSWRVGIDTSTGTAYRMSGSTTVTETWPSGEVLCHGRFPGRDLRDSHDRGPAGRCGQRDGHLAVLPDLRARLHGRRHPARRVLDRDGLELVRKLDRPGQRSGLPGAGPRERHVQLHRQFPARLRGLAGDGHGGLGGQPDARHHLLGHRGARPSRRPGQPGIGERAPGRRSGRRPGERRGVLAQPDGRTPLGRGDRVGVRPLLQQRDGPRRRAHEP